MENNRVELFKNAFQDKKEPLIFYGTGKIAADLLPEITDYNIVGILDREKTKGNFLGIPIVGMDKLCDIRIKKIIIASAEKNVAVIYRRIAQFCGENKISVYDLTGNNLAEIYALYEADIPYFHKTWKDMHSQIDKHEIISFDIFDTLLVRKALYPITIFDVIEKRIQKAGLKFPSFSKLRLKADSNLNKRQLVPNIYEIYDEMQRMSGISDEEKEYLIKLEIDVEKTFIAPRRSILELFNEIKNHKTIYLVSNMHLTAAILEEILNDCGYSGYKGILVSCDYRSGKQEMLFDLLIQEANISPNQILHIGDSHIMDDIEPQKRSIDTFPIMSMIDMAANSSYAMLLDYDKSLLNQIILGNYLRYAFDDPFILSGTKGRLIVKSLDIYVNLFLSPLALSYTLWILKKAKQLNIDHILYTSRDGYLLHQITDILFKGQECGTFIPYKYFYASRRATSAAAVFDKCDAKELAGRSFQGSLKKRFFIRFGIQIEENPKATESKDSVIDYYIEKYKDEILEKCAQQRKRYGAYICKNNLDEGKYIAVVDQCGVGNVQKGVSKIMNGKKIFGMFLRKMPGVISTSECASFFPIKNGYDANDGLGIAYLTLEQFLSSPEPSLIAFDENGTPVFEKEIRSDAQLKTLNHMHLCTLNYCEEIAKLLPGIEDDVPDWKITNVFLQFLDKKYTDIQIAEFLDMKVEDNFGQGSAVAINKD